MPAIAVRNDPGSHCRGQAKKQNDSHHAASRAVPEEAARAAQGEVAEVTHDLRGL